MNDDQKSILLDIIEYNDYVGLIKFLNFVKETIVPIPINLGSLLNFSFDVNILAEDEGLLRFLTVINRTPLEMAIILGHVKMVEKMVEIKTPITQEAIILLVVINDFSTADKIKLLNKFLEAGAIFSMNKLFLHNLNLNCDPEIISYFIGKKIITKKYIRGPCKKEYEKFLSQKYETIDALKKEGIINRDSRGRFLSKKDYIKKAALPNELARKILGYLPEKQFIRRFSRSR